MLAALSDSGFWLLILLLTFTWLWAATWVYAAKTLNVPPLKLVFVPLATVARLVWAWGLVGWAVLLALFSSHVWVVWVACAALAGTGLVLTTRATQHYARSLVERGAEEIRKRYGRA